MVKTGPVILTYHHIVDAQSDPGYLCVTPAHFDQHLDVLCEVFAPVRLDDLAKSLRAGRIPRQAVAITFDDGYADNLHHAKPLLERHGIPATVFVTAGPGDHGPEFWWDEIERLLLSPGKVPAECELSIGGAMVQYRLGESAAYSDDASMRHRGWRAWEEPPTGRHALYVLLRNMLAEMSDEEQRVTMEGVRRWAGAPESNGSLRRRLSADEIVALSAGRLIDVGAHTVTHPRLSMLEHGQQRGEMLESKTYLEEIVAAPVNGLAYPYGDYSADTVNLAREVGFDWACSTTTGAVRDESDRFRLPRLHVNNLDGDGFLDWLRRSWIAFERGEQVRQNATEPE